MKKIRNLLLIALSVLLIISASCYFVLATDNSAQYEATLTATVENGEPVTYNGTLNEMAAKLKTEAAKVSDAKTVFDLVVNKDCSFTTFSRVSANENTTINFNINGHHVYCTKTYMIEPAGALAFNLSGKDSAGNVGTITLTGTTAAVVYTHSTRASADMPINIEDINLVYTNLSDGFSVESSNTSSQSMTSFQAGKITLRNVNMVYTGEDAKSETDRDFSTFKPAFIYGSSTETVGVTINAYNCKLTDTRQCSEDIPVGTRAVFIGKFANINLYNCEIDSHEGFYNNYTSVLNVVDSKVTVTAKAYSGTGTINIKGTVTNIPEGAVLSDSNKQNHIFHYSYENPTTVNAASLAGKPGYANEIYELVQIKQGTYEVAAKADYEAVLTVTDSSGNETVSTDTFTNLVKTLANDLNANTEYRIVLFKNTTLSTVCNIGKSTATTKVIIDFNGYDITLPSSSIFSLTSGVNVIFDGSDSLGERSTLTCNKKSGAFIYTSKDVPDILATVQNVHLVYTNLSQGYSETTSTATYANQPMVHLRYGKLVFDNVKIEYTGNDATFNSASYAANNEEYKTKYSYNGELATDISWMQTSFIKIYNTAELVIKNCEFIDSNTKGIRTSGIHCSGTAKVDLINTKIVAFDGIINTSTNPFNVSGCDITGNNLTYTNSKTLNIYDTISRVGTLVTDNTAPKDGALLSGKGTTTFYFGEGNNVIISKIEPVVTVESGFKLGKKSEGVYEITINVSDSVNSALTVVEDGKEPVVRYGKYVDFMKEIATAAPESSTVYNLVLYSDIGSVDAPVSGTVFTCNANVTLNIDLNGFDIFLKSNYSLSGGRMNFNINGSNSLNEKGTIHLTHENTNLMITSQAENDNYVVNFSDFKLNIHNYKDNAQKTRQNVIHARGYTVVDIDNVDFVFSGDTATYTEGGVNEVIIICTRGTSFATLNNCTLIDINEKGITVYGVATFNNSGATVNGCDFECDYPVNSFQATTTIDVYDSIVTAWSAAYSITGIINVCDTATELLGTNIISVGGGALNLFVNDGKTEIITAVGAISDLVGTYKLPDDYVFLKTNNGFNLSEGALYYSTARTSAIISSNMVYQRGEPINVYGVSNGNGNRITVTLTSSDGTQETLDTYVEDGQWLVSFPARDAERGLSLTMVEEASLETKTFANYTNIDIGDVWFIGGQSNAAYELYKMEDAAQYIANADNFDNIRVYSQNHNFQFTPDLVGAGVWNIADSAFLAKGDVGAIAYVMATRLAGEFPDLTIAIVDVNFSGSNIQCWIDEEEFAQEFGKNDSEYLSYKAMQEFYLENGRAPSNQEELTAFNNGKYTARPAVSIYNAMIAHLEGYNTRGVVWYQGCSNMGTIDKYPRYFDALQKSWRSVCGNDDTPFFVVQIAPYVSTASFDFRSMQYLLSDYDENTFVLNASTEGNVMNVSDLSYSPVSGGSSSPMVHPSRKSPVGHRVADSVLKNVYGLYQDRVVEAPSVVSITYSDGRVVVTFDTELSVFYGDSVEGFEVAGSNGLFYAARATISGKTVILECDAVSEPVTVRYGYGEVITIELVDGTLIKAVTGTKDGPHINNKSEGYVVIVDINGTSHTIYAADDAVIRSFIPGNVTNDSGHPLSVFKLAVGYGTEA